MPKRMRLRDRIVLRRAQAAERRSRKPEPAPEPEIEIALRKAGSIGALERLAGIGRGASSGWRSRPCRHSSAWTPAATSSAAAPEPPRPDIEEPG